MCRDSAHPKETLSEAQKKEFGLKRSYLENIQAIWLTWDAKALDSFG